MPFYTTLLRTPSIRACMSDVHFSDFAHWVVIGQYVMGRGLMDRFIQIGKSKQTLDCVQCIPVVPFGVVSWDCLKLVDTIGNSSK